MVDSRSCLDRSGALESDCNPIGLTGASRISWGEVKFQDPRGTTRGESRKQGHARWSRTKVRGSKMIRYRRSPDRKRYRLDGAGGSGSDTRAVVWKL